MAPTIWHRLDRALAAVRPWRQPLSLAIDAFVVVAAWNLTYLFRLGFDRWWSARPGYDGWVIAGITAGYLAVFVAAGVPRGLWRFSGFGEVQRLALASFAAGLAAAVVVLMAQLTKVPRSVLALHPLVTLMGLCIVRLGYRMLHEHARTRIAGDGGEIRRALVMGAGEAAKRLLATIHQQGWEVVGLLDDDPAKAGGRIGGVPVLGSLADVSKPDMTVRATHVVVALPGAAVEQRRRAIELAAATGLPVLTVPSASELREDSARVERVRAVEPEDLLGREPVQLDEAGIAEMVSGRVVLVTGAGGSIGSELCRQIARYGPARLVLFELSEYALYRVEQQLAEAHPGLPLVALIGDVKVAEQIGGACRTWRPQLVFHAAAYKHVPLMEDANAWAAVRNNTLGTVQAARAAAACCAHRFVLVSTDKAVNPTNVMGATKRAAEMALAWLAARGEGRGSTRFVAVRFGNVLGSSGSVIPRFKAQIARGGPVTVTHPDITRYFMTIPEAARLVLQAAELAASGEVWVLDMGQPVRIVDLARDLIRLSGHRDGEIRIVFTGLRPGEKLYEELLADADQTLPSSHPRLRIARLSGPPADAWFGELLAWMERVGPQVSAAETRARLAGFVPEYRAADDGALPEGVVAFVPRVSPGPQAGAERSP
jgi:FlaA1/EpsC-like NDP-sugar epimerase